MSTYQSAYPVTAKITKPPTTKWEVDNGRTEVIITGCRGSFMHLWRVGTYQENPANSLASDFIIPLTPETKPARDVIIEAFNIAAAACNPPSEYGDIAESKIKEVPLGAPRMKKGKPQKDEDGNPLTAYNDGHLVISTTNPSNANKKLPPAYFTMANKQLKATVNDSPKDAYDTYIEPVEPSTGQKASELLAAGNNVRIKIGINRGTDNDGDPKVWINLMAIQFLAEDQPLGSGGDSGTVDSEGFETVVPTEKAMESAPADDNLFA